MRYVELHFHLLPGADDGPRSIEESVALAAAAADDGTETVVTTPHVHPAHVTDPAEIAERVRELADRLRQERVSLEVLPGGEIAHGMVERLADRQLSAVAHGPSGRRWLLLEAPFAGIGDAFTSAADELRRRGFGVVVAHPERTPMTPTAFAALEHELSCGSALQLTASAFAGINGELVRTTALGLLRSAPRVVIASDAHGGDRMPAMRLGLRALGAAGYRDPARLAGASPRRLLEKGLAVDPAAAGAGSRRGGYAA